MAEGEWNRNQEKNTRLQDLAAVVSGEIFFGFIVLALCILCQQGVRGQARRIQLTDFGKAISVSDPQISPDGKSIVYVVSRMNMEQDRNDRDLVLHEIATAARRALTHDRKDVGSPRWSPSADRIAFLAAVGPAKEEKAQIFVLSMSGGDALKITDVPGGVEQFAWSPVSVDIADVTADEPENKKNIEKHLGEFEICEKGYCAPKSPK